MTTTATAPVTSTTDPVCRSARQELRLIDGTWFLFEAMPRHRRSSLTGTAFGPMENTGIAYRGDSEGLFIVWMGEDADPEDMTREYEPGIISLRPYAAPVGHGAHVALVGEIKTDMRKVPIVSREVMGWYDYDTLRTEAEVIAARMRIIRKWFSEDVSGDGLNFSRLFMENEEDADLAVYLINRFAPPKE